MRPSMRVVGGEWRGRPIDAPPDDGTTRPTTDRARESLFNVLAHDPLVRLRGGAVLDAFAGTGALGIEALSRGAAAATFVERDAAARRRIAGTLRRFGVGAVGGAADREGSGGERVRILALDATRPGAPPLAHDLVLLDPPYGRGLGERALRALAAGGWLAVGATVVIEEEAGATPAWPDGFVPARELRVGATRFHLARHEPVGHPLAGQGRGAT